MNNILDSKKGQEILIYLLRNRNANSSKMHFKLNITYSHVSKLINNFVKEDLIKSERQERTNILNLSERGKLIARKLIELEDII